jgi:hypothetical protein
VLMGTGSPEHETREAGDSEYLNALSPTSRACY